MKKGFTLVELLVSLVLITILSLALFKTVVNIQEKQMQNIAINKFKAFEVALNSEIEEDFLKDEIKEITECGKNCYNIEYKNRGIVKISIDTDNNTITYGTLKEKIPDDYKLYSDMTITKYESEIEGVNSYIYLDIPINSSLEPSKDGLKYMYVYDKNKNSIKSTGVISANDIEIYSNIEKLLLLKAYPVGSIYISTTNTNPSGLFGGTWVSFGNGRALVGVDTSQSEFNTVEKTGGEKAHRINVEEMPIINFDFSLYNGVAQDGRGWVESDINGLGFKSFNVFTGSSRMSTPNTNDAVETLTDVKRGVNYAFGNDMSHNNLQPYITTYMWKRTS